MGVLPTAGACRAHLLTEGLCDLVAATAATLGAVKALCLQDSLPRTWGGTKAATRVSAKPLTPAAHTSDEVG